jgi:NAD-dependent SIR2 family protein deacetylase
MHKLNNKVNNENNNEFSRLNEIIDKWIDLNKDNLRITIFLGAGASIPSKIPGLQGITSKLVEKAKMHNVGEVIDYLENIPDVEKALTLLQILEVLERFDMSNLIRLRKIKSIRHYKYIHQTLTSFLDEWLDDMFKAEPNKTHISIAKFISYILKNNINVNISIVTTNYDCCMEKALLYENIIINTHMTEITERQKCVELIKIHGSINWYYCPHCLEVQEYDIEKVCNIIRNGILPKFQCERDNSIMRRVIVLPYYFKLVQIPKIIDIWQKGKEAIINSNLIIIVGYSFPETDDYLRQIFKQAFMNDSTFVIVVDPSENVKAEIEKFSEIVGKDFNNRVIYLQHKAEEVILKVFNTIIDLIKKSINYIFIINSLKD